MSHNVNPRRLAAALRKEAEAKAREEAPARHRQIKAARTIVGLWNSRQVAGREICFYPTVRAAIDAHCPWLGFHCPACDQYGQVDLRKLDIGPLEAISALVPRLACRRCAPNPPAARLMLLSGRPVEMPAWAPYRPPAKRY